MQPEKINTAQAGHGLHEVLPESIVAGQPNEPGQHKREASGIAFRSGHHFDVRHADIPNSRSSTYINFLSSNSMGDFQTEEQALDLLERVYHIVKAHPSWREPKFSKNVTTTELIDYIFKFVSFHMQRGHWSPMEGIFIGDPRRESESEIIDLGLKAPLHVVSCIKGSEQSHAGPAMCFLPQLQKRDPNLFFIILCIVHKLWNVCGFQPWNMYVHEMYDMLQSNAIDDSTGDSYNEDGELVTDAEMGYRDMTTSQTEIIWLDRKDSLDLLFKNSAMYRRLPIDELQKKINRYRWNRSWIRRETRKFVDLAMQLIRMKFNVRSYCFILDSFDVDYAHPPDMIKFFRWYGTHSDCPIEEEIDSTLQTTFNESGFYPARVIWKEGDPGTWFQAHEKAHAGVEVYEKMWDQACWVFSGDDYTNDLDLKYEPRRKKTNKN